MVETRSARFGMVNWGAGTDSPSRLDFNEAFTQVENLAARFDAAGTLAARPASGIARRLYYATDNGRLYLDTGSTWVVVGAKIDDLEVQQSAAGVVPAIIRTVAGNTSDILQVINSAGTVLIRLNSVGDLISNTILQPRRVEAAEAAITDLDVTGTFDLTGTMAAASMRAVQATDTTDVTIDDTTTYIAGTTSFFVTFTAPRSGAVLITHAAQITPQTFTLNNIKEASRGYHSFEIKTGSDPALGTVHTAASDLNGVGYHGSPESSSSTESQATFTRGLTTTVLITGLTAGSTYLCRSMMKSANNETCIFDNRRLLVIPQP